MKTCFNEIINKLSARPLLLPALLGIVGMYMCYLCRCRVPAVILIVILSVCAALLLLREKKFGRMWFILAFSAFLQVSVFFFTANCFYGEAFPGASVFGDSMRIEISGYVRSVRYRSDGTIEAVITDPQYGRLLYRCENESVEGEAVPSAGAAVSCHAVLKTAGTAANPGEFDQASYLRRQGIRGNIEGNIRFIPPDSFASLLLQRLTDITYRIREYVTGVFGEDRPLASAVFMGDTSLLDDEDIRAFRLAGCSHLLAVSGTHFTGFLMLLPYAMKKLKLKKPASVTCYALLCIVLGLLTGWSPSVTRAAVMSFCTFAFKDRISAMAMAACLLLFADPFSVLSSGFLMSFSAAAAIMYLGPALKEKLGSGALAYTIAAMTGMMPFWIDIGTSLSPSSLFVQMAASFTAQMACVIFTPAVLAAVIFGSWAADIAMAPLRLMMAGIRAYSSIALYAPGSRLLGPLLIGALFVFVIVKALPRVVIREVLVKTGSLILALALGIYAGGLIIRPSVSVVFIDVGQGDSCLLRSGGKTVLVDGGTYEAGQAHVSAVLDYYSIQKVDVAFISHWDLDHAGGIVWLYQQGRIDRVFAPEPADRSGIEEMFRLLEADPIDYTGLWRGMSVSVGDMEFVCLGPGEGEALLGSNDDSLVLCAHAGGAAPGRGTSILFTGDIGQETENEMCSLGLIPDIDILKVAHHGSRFSSSEGFLRAASPEYAVISAGRRNVYGHPAPDTLERLSSFSESQIHCTAWEGAVFVDIYGNGLKVRGMVG